ncbi:hypothetical protein FACS1894218_0830 [Bacilli bacterium]|nr:hypothetical protein FACS1894218_0830 [Bacilli bacterium]
MVESNPFKPSKTDITTIIINTNILQINSNSPSDIWKGIQDANPNLPVNINEGIFN